MAMVQNLSLWYYMSARPQNDKCEEINLQIVVWYINVMVHTVMSLYIMYTSLRSLHTASTGFNRIICLMINNTQMAHIWDRQAMWKTIRQYVN